MDAEKLDRIDKQFKADQFRLAAQHPAGWKSVSLDLKHAADRLYDLHHDAVLRITERLRERIISGRGGRGSRKLEGEELEDVNDSHVLSIYYLLMGYAIENLLKAILMILNPGYFKPDAKLIDIRSHGLVSLCQRCHITVGPEEDELLRKLTAYIEWRGKYPIPLLADDMWPNGKADGKWKVQFKGYRGRQPQEAVNRLYDKIREALERTQKASPAPDLSDD